LYDIIGRRVGMGIQLCRPVALSYYIAYPHFHSALFAFVSFVHYVLDFLRELCLDFCCLKHIEIVSIWRHASKRLLQLLIEDHVKQPDSIKISITLPSAILCDLAQFARLKFKFYDEI